jgi:hypothetical protein
MRSITFQTLVGLLANHQALLNVLAYVDAVMVLRTDAALDLTISGSREDQERYINIIKALLPHAQRRAGLSLAQILCEQLSDDQAKRVLFLKTVAQRLSGHIAPLADLTNSTQSPPVLRATLQQFALRLTPTEMMSAAVCRRSM